MINFREMIEEDLIFFNETRNLSKEFLHDNTFFSLEQTKNWFKNNTNKYYIILNDEEKIGYFRTSNFVQKQTIYIGADLHPSFRGKGYAKIAYKLFINFIFNTYYVEKILLEVLENNNIAYNLYKKLGFLEESRDRKISRDNESICSIFMSLTKKGWNNE